MGFITISFNRNNGSFLKIYRFLEPIMTNIAYKLLKTNIGNWTVMTNSTIMRIVESLRMVYSIVHKVIIAGIKSNKKKNIIKIFRWWWYWWWTIINYFCIIQCFIFAFNHKIIYSIFRIIIYTHLQPILCNHSHKPIH